MATGLGPELVVPAPPLTPPPNGMLRTASVVDHTEDDYRGGNGIRFAPEICGQPIAFDPCSSNPQDVVLVVTDAVTTNGSAVVTSATAAFKALDVGRLVTGSGIPATPSTTILAVNSPTQVTLSANATATATGVTLTIPYREPIPSHGPIRTFLPIAIEAYDECSTFGWQQNEYNARALRALSARATTAVEKEFAGLAVQTANIGLFTNSTNTVVSLNGGTALGPIAAFCALVQAAATYGLGTAQIHARPSLVERWGSLQLIQQDNRGLLWSRTGISIIPGTGYSGNSPTGSVATSTSEWAYVTDPVQVHRWPPEIFADDIGHQIRVTQNFVTTRAQQLYVVALNACAVVGANVNVSLSS